MARITGIDLPRKKRIEVALTYIYGIGRSSSRKILSEARVNFDTKTENLTEAEIARIRDIITSSCKVEGDLRKEVSQNIRRLIDIGCYRGIRHRRGLPVRGQRTNTNARTRKGPRKMIIKKRVEVKK